MAEEQVQYTYKHEVVNGTVFPAFITQEKYDLACTRVPLQTDDIIISTYPKSGTTWTQKIVRLVVHGPIPKGLKLADVVPWHEAEADHMDTSLLPSPRIFKSHLDWPMTYKPEGKPLKYIYVARNGKDVAVSMFYHSRGWKTFEYDGDWDHWYDIYSKGEVEFGLWQEHVKSWWNVRDRDDVLFLFYEDMLADPAAAVKSIADFVGVSLSSERVEEVVKATSFTAMQKDPQSNYSIWKSKFRKDGAQNFMRKGEIGDWKTHFSPDQAAHFDAAYANLLQECPDISFRFE